MAKVQSIATATDIPEAQRVLRHASAALEHLAASLGADFSQAVDTLETLAGRVIVTGMGKAGRIGNKVAATLASTGTPACFVHPGEASHGDLGMITQNDAVLMLSHSGESKELSDIIAYCQRFDIPLIAITGRRNSTLGQAATVTLCNEVTEEACPINMAPTTSTTVSLALADALAVALMQRRGFKPDDFARYHPGGKLGAKLLRVEEIMLTDDDLPLITNTATMDQVILTLSEKNLGCVGVVDSTKQLVGIITDGDLKRHMSKDLLSKPAETVMTTNPMTIEPSAFATTGVQIWQDKKITSPFFVLNEHSQPVGLFRLQECLLAGVV